MTAVRLLTRAQLGLNIAHLESLDARRASLQAALVDAQTALEQAQPDKSALRAAQADIDVLHPELAAVDTVRDALLLEIQRQRRSFARTLLEAFLPELLSAIFLEVVAGPDWVWEESILVDGSYNAARNRAPFIIAAVCGRWRSIAVDTPGLWAYIGVPPLIRKCDMYCDRVKTLLMRSKKHPLDVMLDWGQSDTRIASWLGREQYQLIFNDVARHIDRWRRVQLILPHDLEAEHITLLHKPAPLLVHLSIVPSDADDEMLPWSPDPRILPVCPRLETLCAVKMFIVPQHPLPSLRELYIRIDNTPLDVVWDLLRQSPAIEDLILHHAGDAFPEMADRNVNLPALLNLGLTGDLTIFLEMLYCMTMPALKSLRIFTSEVDSIAWIPVLILQRVSTLFLVGEIEDEVALDAAAAANLSQLEHIETFELSEYRYDSAEGLFAALAQSGTMWPELQSVRIVDCVLVEPACAEGFLGFAVSRRDIRANGGLSPFRVTLVDTEIPPWLDADIRANFGDTAIESWDSER